MATELKAVQDNKGGSPGTQDPKRPAAQAPAPAGTAPGIQAPRPAAPAAPAPATGSAPKTAVGPLAEALRKGAAVGTPEKPLQAEPAAPQKPETIQEIRTQEKREAINKTIIKGLESKNKDARLMAIHLAGEVGGPEVAGMLAMSAATLLVKKNDKLTVDQDVSAAATKSLARLLEREGAAAIPHLRDAMVPVGQICENMKVYAHLNAMATAIGEARLAEGIDALNQIMDMCQGWEHTEKLAMGALAKATGVDMG